MDLDVEQRKLEMQYKDNKNKDYLISRDLLQKEVNMEKLCESGAKDRVIRELLGVGKPYTLKEIALEFVMVRIVPKFDMQDEYTRKRLIDIKLASMAGVYGMGPSLLPEPAKPQDVIEVAAPIDITNEQNGGQTPPADDIPNFSSSPEPEPELDTGESQVVDFNSMEIAEQEKTLQKMAAAARYDLTSYCTKSGKRSVSELKPETREKLFRHLAGIPAKAA
jgi:rRNA maturation protein Nop10